MICLGIETSCDETALAIVRDGVLIEQVLASQSGIHALFGGVVPELASREHYRFLGTLFDELLEKTNLSCNAIDYIGVSRGPGLLGGLLTGVAFAKALAVTCDAQFLGIDHLQAHLLVAGLMQEMPFPCMGLLVSGGHTQIYRMNSPSHFVLLGRTLDDAAGEAFDKIGTLLGMPYPCGQLFDAIARKGNIDEHLFPRPYLKNDNLNFSFSGLKTAAAQFYQQKLQTYSNFRFSDDADNVPNALQDFIATFNHAIVETIIAKLDRAFEYNPELQNLAVAGGVAANSMLRERLKKFMGDRGGKILFPSLQLCTDNAAMVAYATFLLGKAGFYHNLDMPTIPRGTPIPADMRQFPRAGMA